VIPSRSTSRPLLAAGAAKVLLLPLLLDVALLDEVLLDALLSATAAYWESSSPMLLRSSKDRECGEIDLDNMPLATRSFAILSSVDISPIPLPRVRREWRVFVIERFCAQIFPSRVVVVTDPWCVGDSDLLLHTTILLCEIAAREGKLNRR